MQKGVSFWRRYINKVSFCWGVPFYAGNTRGYNSAIRALGPFWSPPLLWRTLRTVWTLRRESPLGFVLGMITKASGQNSSWVRTYVLENVCYTCILVTFLHLAHILNPAGWWLAGKRAKIVFKTTWLWTCRNTAETSAIMLVSFVEVIECMKCVAQK